MSAQAQGRPSPLDVHVEPFSITEEPVGSDGRILAVRGELDLGTQPELRERLVAAVDSGVRRLIVDLSHVTFVDSVSVAAIVKAHNRLGDGGRLAVVLAQDSYAMLIFEVGGMGSVLELTHSREEALARVSG
jgi:anti-anti-sigma factor